MKYCKAYLYQLHSYLQKYNHHLNRRAWNSNISPLQFDLQQLSMKQNKQKKIKKEYQDDPKPSARKRGRKSKKEKDDGDNTSVASRTSTIIKEDDFDQASLPDLPMSRPLPCDLRRISNLDASKRQKVKSQHPQMPEYFFLPSRQKSKYFHLLNLKYRSDIQPSQPSGSAPMKKTITFKTRFEVKRFSNNDKCTKIKGQTVRRELHLQKKSNKKR